MTVILNKPTLAELAGYTRLDSAMEHSDDIVDIYLEHYGVKGMKWGVRQKESSTDKSYRKEAKKAFSDKMTANGGPLEARLDRMFDSTGVTQEQYKSLSSKDVVIKKGSTLNRITKNPDDYKASKALYVSSNKKDAEIYRAVMPVVGFLAALKRNPAKNHYEVTYQATKNLKSPSEKARVDAFIQLMDSPEIKLKNGKTMTGREWLRRAGYAREVKRLDSYALGLRFYHEFTASQGLANSALNTAYFDKLRERGYNAVIDDHDRKIVSNEPLIVLDASYNLKGLNVKPLTNASFREAQLNLEFPTKTKTIN